MRRGDICAVFSLLVSCAAFVGPPPKCACRGRALRASVPQPDEADDPISQELTGLVTRAELSVGFADLRSDIRSLATELRSEVRVGVESQQIASTAFFFSLLLLGVLGFFGYSDLSKEVGELSDKVTKLAPEVAKIDKVATEFDLYKDKVTKLAPEVAKIDKVATEFDLYKDKVTKLAPEVAKIDKVATEFDLYKNGANAILAALAGATIGAAITATFTYLYNLQQTKEP